MYNVLVVDENIFITGYWAKLVVSSKNHARLVLESLVFNVGDFFKVTFIINGNWLSRIKDLS